MQNSAQRCFAQRAQLQARPVAQRLAQMRPQKSASQRQRVRDRIGSWRLLSFVTHPERSTGASVPDAALPPWFWRMLCRRGNSEEDSKKESPMNTRLRIAARVCACVLSIFSILIALPVNAHHRDTPRYHVTLLPPLSVGPNFINQ